MGHPKKNREKADRSDTTDPDLERNTINYRDNHKHRDAITINTEMQQK